MVVQVLYVKATMSEGTASLIMPDSWCCTVKHSAGEEERGPVFISSEEDFELAGSRGTAHFKLRWEGSQKDSHATVLTQFGKKKQKTRQALTMDDDDFVAVAAFECRGLELSAWHPGGGFSVVAEDGQTFDDVDLVEGDWFDVTEDGESVGIEEIEYKIERI